MYSVEIDLLAQRTIKALVDGGMTITTAESCTGGLICGALTAVPGSSQAVYGGFVTYANTAKNRMIAVPMEILNNHGAVSEQAARAMAEGALKKSGANIAIAVTGIAGPTGGSAEKPVGLVYIGCATNRETYYQEEQYGNIGRDAVREKTIIDALKMTIDVMRSDQP